VVEDEPQIRKMLFRFLQAQGYTVSLATNGVEALEQVQKERPDLLLLDVNMPVMNGLEVLQQLKQHKKRDGTWGDGVSGQTCYTQETQRIHRQDSG